MMHNPSKALALSFHGGPGTGKNYVGKIIAESIFKKGMGSKYVHLISASHRYIHQDLRSVYKDRLKEEVENGVKECLHSLFIIDDIHTMPDGVLDVLKPYLKNHQQLDGIDYRKTIFLFLSNTAAESISEYALNKWLSGSKRSDLKQKEIEDIIGKATINSKPGGFYHSEILLKHMTSAYVPFLPLERKQVKQCIEDFLIEQLHFKPGTIPKKKVSEIAGEMNYFPKDSEVFSVFGCKRIQEKVILLISE